MTTHQSGEHLHACIFLDRNVFSLRIGHCMCVPGKNLLALSSVNLETDFMGIALRKTRESICNSEGSSSVVSIPHAIGGRSSQEKDCSE